MRQDHGRRTFAACVFKLVSTKIAVKTLYHSRFSFVCTHLYANAFIHAMKFHVCSSVNYDNYTWM